MTRLIDAYIDDIDVTYMNTRVFSNTKRDDYAHAEGVMEVMKGDEM